MNTERIYSGRITSIKQAGCDTLGFRYYQVIFSGKQLLYICHKKTTLPISIGDRIRFTGTWENVGDNKYFQIREIISDEKIEQLESHNLAEVLTKEEMRDALAEAAFLLGES